MMTYDYHGSWETRADNPAPLYKRSWDTTNLWVDFTVSYWISKGATPSKLVLGIPLYGHAWTLSSSATTPPVAGASVGIAGPYTQQAGSLAYYEICTAMKNGGWTVVTDPTLAVGPFTYSLSLKQWLGYDDANMAAYKTTYALSKGLGGVMVWDVSMDDFRNTCSGGVNPLITAISNTLAQGTNYTTIAPSSTGPTIAPPPTQSTAATTSIATTPFTGTCE